jgi:hypothetical protein
MTLNLQLNRSHAFLTRNGFADLLQQHLHSLRAQILMMSQCMFLVVLAPREVAVTSRLIAEEPQLLMNGKVVPIEIILRLDRIQFRMNIIRGRSHTTGGGGPKRLFFLLRNMRTLPN